MHTYVVTGGAGFIGSHLAHALVARGDRVRVLDDFSSGRLENLAALSVGRLGTDCQVELVEGSICDALACREVVQGARGVFHEAAQVSVPKSIEAPVASYEVNALGTLNVLEAARAAGVLGVVLAASSAAYGDGEELPKTESLVPSPVSPYAAGKIAGEHLLRVYARVYGLKTVSLRYFNVFGPRQADDSPYTGVIALFARALLENSAPTIFGDGSQSRDFTYVENVVHANLLAMDLDSASGQVLNVGTGESITIRALFDAMAAELGSSLQPRFAPARVGDVQHSLASLERTKAVLGYAPLVSWRDGLRRTVAWYRDRAAVAR